MTKKEVKKRLQEWEIEATAEVIEAITNKINNDDINLDSGLDIDYIAYLIS